MAIVMWLAIATKKRGGFVYELLLRKDSGPYL
jgi:hypothetical protein